MEIRNGGPNNLTRIVGQKVLGPSALRTTNGSMPMEGVEEERCARIADGAGEAAECNAIDL